MTISAVGMHETISEVNVGIAGALPGYLKVSEAARLIRRTPETIRYWLKHGIVVGMRLNSGHWLVSTNSLLEMMQLTGAGKVTQGPVNTGENGSQSNAEEPTQTPITA